MSKPENNETAAMSGVDSSALFELAYVQGVEGNSIYLNDFRIAGPKPWGGGKVLKRWTVKGEDLNRALNLPSNHNDQGEAQPPAKKL